MNGTPFCITLICVWMIYTTFWFMPTCVKSKYNQKKKRKIDKNLIEKLAKSIQPEFKCMYSVYINIRQCPKYRNETLPNTIDIRIIYLNALCMPKIYTSHFHSRIFFRIINVWIFLKGPTVQINNLIIFLICT